MREGLLHGECLIEGCPVVGRIGGMLCAFFFREEGERGVGNIICMYRWLVNGD